MNKVLILFVFSILIVSPFVIAQNHVNGEFKHVEVLENVSEDIPIQGQFGLKKEIERSKFNENPGEFIP